MTSSAPKVVLCMNPPSIFASPRSFRRRSSSQEPPEKGSSPVSHSYMTVPSE